MCHLCFDVIRRDVLQNGIHVEISSCVYVPSKKLLSSAKKITLVLGQLNSAGKIAYNIWENNTSPKLTLV